MSCASQVNSCSSLFHRVCLIQHLAFQTDVNYATLHDSADGLSTWPAQIACVCHASSASSAINFAVLDTSVYHINHLTRDQLHLLWHQCLGHLHSRRVSDMHKFAIGIPSVPLDTDRSLSLFAPGQNFTRLLVVATLQSG